MTNTTEDARRMLHAWPTRVRINGAPLVLNLATAERWSAGPVDAVRAFQALAK